MSEHPVRLEIEPRPGGGILGDLRRLRATASATPWSPTPSAPEVLRFEGPLGLTGHALHMVTTYGLAAVGQPTARASR